VFCHQPTTKDFPRVGVDAPGPDRFSARPGHHDSKKENRADSKNREKSKKKERGRENGAGKQTGRTRRPRANSAREDSHNGRAVGGCGCARPSSFVIQPGGVPRFLFRSPAKNCYKSARVTSHPLPLPCLPPPPPIIPLQILENQVISRPSAH
jgi:hypothetical protein